MYYLLSYIPLAKKAIFLESLRQDDEQPSTSSTPIYERVPSQKVMNVCFYWVENGLIWFIDYTCMAFQFKYKFIWQLSEKVVRAVKRVTQNRTAILYTCRHFLTGFFIQKLTKIVVRRKIANLNCFGQFSKCKQNHDLSFVYTTKNCEIRILLILNDWLWQILVDY